MSIKLDIETYDILIWKFIIDLGFSDKWIHWITECITTTSFSVLVNGLPGEPIPPKEVSDKVI